MPLSPTRLFVCTACGAALPVGDEHLGKQCRCGRCGKVSLVTDEAEELARQRRAKQAAAENQPIGFYCRVCDTRLTARVKHVGRKAKCPDCGALTEVPPPPKQRPRQKPAAMHGQQYGVWGVDDAPTPAELSARQPKFFPVYCRVCDTLMHARREQVGRKLACPDCGAKTKIKEPPQSPPKKSALVPDGQEYQLDTTQPPPVRAASPWLPPQPVAEQQQKKSEPIRQSRAPRPKIPRLPTFQGVLPMLVRSPVWGWWLWLTVVAAMEVGLIQVVLAPADGVAGMLMILACYGMAFSLGAIWLSAASAIGLAVLTESSEGNDRLHHPPGYNFLEWFGDLLFPVTAGMLALAPWWLLCRVLQQELTLAQQGVVQISGWLFTFPLLFLSGLENGSPWEVFSPKLLGSLSKLPGHWLLLFVQSVLLVEGCLLAVAGLLTLDLRLAYAAVPLCVAAGFFYFRLLGRFAWWLAESLMTVEDE